MDYSKRTTLYLLIYIAKNTLKQQKNEYQIFMAGCMSFFSGFSSSTGMLPRKMVHYSPKTYIIPAQKLVLLSWTLVFTGVQTIPQNGVLFPKKLVLWPRKKVCYY